jgi:secreted PhoX family phosphatase
MNLNQGVHSDQDRLDQGLDQGVSNNSNNETFEQVLARRTFIKGAAVAASMLVINPSSLAGSAHETSPPPLTFVPIQGLNADTVTVPPGYDSQVVIRWGDPLFRGVPSLDIDNQTPQSQARQFGYNCDFVGFFPFSKSHDDDDRHDRDDHDRDDGRRRHDKRVSKGLLVVNHEYTDARMMFRNYVSGQPTREQVDIELAAHGVTVVAIKYGKISHVPRAYGWSYEFSRYNRRITGESAILVTGPAAGDDLLKTSSDPTGRRVRGTFNNCAAGKTPWGTVLTCEENFNQYFANNANLPNDDPRKAIHARYGLPNGASERAWEQYHDRFDVSKEPNEPFRFGWVVEIDPFDPYSIPKKRTALGRTKHEAATVVISDRGHAVVYSGDDERFDYMYKFVSEKKYNSRHCRANFDLLDSGTLYVAKFNDDGTGRWIPLVAGQGALAEWTQAEICINTRGAADLVGATKMDRPEDIETNPVNGKLYCAMTNNTQRGTTGRPGTDPANPRANNRHGHIIELTEEVNDAAATSFTWEIFCLCGDPSNPADGTFYAGWQGFVSPISSPDNITFDGEGNLWIATDGQPGTLQKADGIYAVPVEGPQRGFLRQFLSSPNASEVCGPEFTPDNRTLFCAIQHPGEGGTISAPVSTWPDGASPARPSVVAIQNDGGNRVIGR